jgi:hypothetical protein
LINGAYYGEPSRFGRNGLVRKIVASVALVVSLAGCGDGNASANRAARNPSAQPTTVTVAAGDAGGACQLIDYDMIKATVGLDFSVAAAGQRDNTYTCVTQGRGASFPDLVLAVSATVADETVFKSTVQPKSATAVAGLGKLGFSMTFAAVGNAGPGVEVGWLAGNGRLLNLRLRLAASATPEQATEAVPRVVALAKRIDRASA